MDILKAIQASIDVKTKMMTEPSYVQCMEEIIEVLVASFRSGGRVYFCGNGGSAADAQHLAAELSGRFYLDRKALPAEALHVNSSYMTAISNDYSFDEAYARWIEGIGRKGDVLIGISTSGDSKNIVNAMERAKLSGLHTVGFTGEKMGLMDAYCDLLLKVPSADTPRIQEAHILAGHIICQSVEEKLFS